MRSETISFTFNYYFMRITGDVYDKATGKGIPAASVTIFDKNGIYSGQGTAADSNGRFEIESNALDHGGKIEVSAVGYGAVKVDPYIFLQTSMVGLSVKATDLPEVVVYPRKENDNILLWLGAAALIVYKVATTK